MYPESISHHLCCSHPDLNYNSLPGLLAFCGFLFHPTVKVKALTVYTAVHFMCHILFIMQSDPATRSRLAYTWEPLHWLFPLLGTLFSQRSVLVCSFVSLDSLLKCYFLSMACPNHPPYCHLLLTLHSSAPFPALLFIRHLLHSNMHMYLCIHACCPFPLETKLYESKVFWSILFTTFLHIVDAQ